MPERDRRGGGNKAPLYIRAKARGGDDGRRVDWLGWATSRPRGAARPLGGAGGDLNQRDFVAQPRHLSAKLKSLAAPSAQKICFGTRRAPAGRIRRQANVRKRNFLGQSP